MKRAAVVVGQPSAGKSTTIRKFRKLVKTEEPHVFKLKGRSGYILSTSFEETERPIEETVKKHSDCYFLVLACQGRLLKRVRRALLNASYRPQYIAIASPKEAKQKAKEVYRFLIS